MKAVCADLFNYWYITTHCLMSTSLYPEHSLTYWREQQPKNRGQMFEYNKLQPLKNPN